jgi:hypothetical protein
LAERVLLKIVYLLTCRVLGLIVMLARGDLLGSNTRTWL